MAYYTRPDFSRQIKQYSNTIATLSGQTNILEKFSVKNIEIDTAGALDGNALLYDSANNKFVPAVIGAFGSGIVQGLILTYDSGLTYNISSGSFRIGPTLYEGYLGGSVTISSGQTGGSRFDVVYITSGVTALVKSGVTATNPSIPALSGGELQIGIIFVPVNFTGGTGTTVIQTTADTVFEYYNAGTGIQRSPNTTNAEAPGAFSFALANNSKAYGEHSSALGYHSKASGYSQTVVGPYNNPNTDDYFQVGNGTSDGSRSNAFTVTTGGSAYIQNKLFVTNIEVETTGASSNYALIHDGSKFTPQLLTLQKITESGNTTTNSIKVAQISATSIFLSSGFTFISGYNSYSDPSDFRRPLMADDLGYLESKTDIYQLNYFTEIVNKGINPLNSDIYSAITASTSFGYNRTATTITVGKESYVKITSITSGDTAIGTIFRNRFQTKNYNANNTLDNTSKNLVGTALFNQFDSSRFNTSPVLGTLMETHLLGNQTNTRHYEVRNLQLGFFNRAWVNFNTIYSDPRAINITKSIYDLYISRPVFNAQGYNAFTNNSAYGLSANTSAGIFIESKTRISETQDDVIGRPLSSSATINYTHAPWSLFAEADRAYIGSSLVLYSALTLSSTTRGAWLDIGASQATRPHINLSAGTDPSSPQSGDLWWNGTQLYFRSGSTTFNLLSGGTGGSGTGLTTATNLGSGVKVLFSSDTTNLAFATLSSQTPSSLRIISSSTGVILFSATTGSGPVTGNFVPLTGTTYTSPMQGDLVFTGDVNTQVFNGIKTYYDNGGGNTGYTFVNGAGITLGTTDGSIVKNLVINPSFNNTGTTLNIFDTATASGSIVSVPEITGQANKLIKVKSDELGFDFIDGGITYMDLSTAQGGGPFAPGQWYRIPVSSRTVSESSNPNTYGDIMVLAVETGKTSPDGYLLAINADYQAVGDYTDVANYNQNYGVPYNGLTIGDNFNIQTDIVIWDNQHFAAINTEYTLTQATDITASLTPLPKDYTTRNGYIIEPQKIIYDVITDTIKRMEDKRGNVVTYPSIEYFKFGDDNVYNNTVLTPQGFPISNFPTTNIENNIVNQGTIADLNLSNSLANNISLDLINCSINDVNFRNNRTTDLKLSGCTIQDGKVIKIGTNNVTITSSTLVLDSTISNAIYEYIINATGGTFNGIITAITQNNALPFTTRHRIYNNLTTGTITFKNGADLKTEGGLDAILNRYDNVEFSYHSTTPTILRQTDINNYI